MKHENIAVAPTAIINTLYPYAISLIAENDITFLSKHITSHQRYLAENDFTIKQLVAYLIVIYKKKIFLVQRKHNCSEQRLANKYSIGIGGHLNIDDIKKPFLLWGTREFHEEVLYTNQYITKEFLIINDNTNEVGKLHIGIVYTITLTDSVILLKNELKSGAFYSLQEIVSHDNNLEPWSQLIIRHLNNETDIGNFFNIK